jgi:HEAT repeat protein
MEVLRRCAAADALGMMGPAAEKAIPALERTLTIRVSVDCVLALRVAAARALWRIGQRADLALPHLMKALEDDYWGVARTAIETLTEMNVAGRPAAGTLVALAKKRIDNGPFYFEQYVETADSGTPPLLAAIAEALGKCANDLPETRTVLVELTQNPDAIVRSAAERALASWGSSPTE